MTTTSVSTIAADAVERPAAHAAPAVWRDVAVETVDLGKQFFPRRGIISRLRRDGEGGRCVEAVSGVSLTLHHGEIFGLVGPNGAGKTTLIKMLTTLLEPSSGSARIGQMDVVRRQREVRRLVGLVTSNERSFYWRLTGYQNLCFFADLYRLPPRETREWIDQLVEMLDLRDRIHLRFDAYSTGMRQRMAMARGLLNRPRILFMDEPTKGVDPIAAAQIIRIIKRRIIPQWHPMILITSHNLAEIEKLCDRIAFMRRGRIVACGTMDELRAGTALTREHHLVVRGVAQERLEGMAREAGAAKVEASADATQPGSASLRVAVIRDDVEDAEALPRLIRAVVQAGGDVLRCTEREPTLDDVFDRIIAPGDELQAEAASEEAK